MAMLVVLLLLVGVVEIAVLALAAFGLGSVRCGGWMASLELGWMECTQSCYDTMANAKAMTMAMAINNDGGRSFFFSFSFSKP
ncbi:hypothetical protein GGR57DRAFT_29885 [Xylariaceae sp. FL1272]|nr:hypothetical protein GGR57DRAFT_29885 [Xylariaceae sp. FL1272]